MADTEAAQNNSSTTGEDDLTKQLTPLTYTQRLVVLRDTKLPKTAALEDFQAPALCIQYPQFHSEIIEAYRRFTIFTFRVWTNYDTACNQFFLDRRLDDCGKLMMHPTKLQLLEQIMTDDTTLCRLRFEVGTPFQTLCYVSLRVRKTDPNLPPGLSAAYLPQTGEHPRVMNYMGEVCQRLNDLEFTNGCKGFGLEDIKALASLFRRQPPEAEIERQRYYLGGTSQWMDLARDIDNQGWTDLDALESLRSRGG